MKNVSLNIERVDTNNIPYNLVSTNNDNGYENGTERERERRKLRVLGKKNKNRDTMKGNKKKRVYPLLGCFFFYIYY